MAINSPAEQDAARGRLIERGRHITAVCQASLRGEPVTPQRLAEIRANDAHESSDRLMFNGYSMAAVDRHDLLRHLDTLTAPATPARDAQACTVCGCTPQRPCDDGCERFESSLEPALCTLCAWTVARDAVAGGLYRTAPDGALF